VLKSELHPIRGQGLSMILPPGMGVAVILEIVEQLEPAEQQLAHDYLNAPR
jgi:hypothetical protein